MTQPATIQNLQNTKSAKAAPSSLSDDRLGTIALTHSEAVKATELLKNRIRRVTWMDGDTTEMFDEIFRASRMCYEMAATLADPEVEGARLSRLSSEDVACLYALPMKEDLDGLLGALNALRGRVRGTGPAHPLVADAMAKSVVDIMET